MASIRYGPDSQDLFSFIVIDAAKGFLVLYRGAQVVVIETGGDKQFSNSWRTAQSRKEQTA